MTKVEIRRKIKAMSEKDAKALLEKLIFSASRDGRKIQMTSSEILDTAQSNIWHIFEREFITMRRQCGAAVGCGPAHVRWAWRDARGSK